MWSLLSSTSRIESRRRTKPSPPSAASVFALRSATQRRTAGESSDSSQRYGSSSATATPGIRWIARRSHRHDRLPIGRRGSLPAMQPATKLERRVVTAAEQALTSRHYVSPLDVLTGIGWVPAGLVTDWRQGRAAPLEAVAAVSADRLVDALEVFHRWAASRGLRGDEVEYVA